MKKCILVLTDSDLFSKLYDDDELTGLYANPMLVAENIYNPTFLGWEIELPEIPTTGDYISLSPIGGSLIKQWIEKVANKDEALCYFLNLVKQEPQFTAGECLKDSEIIECILEGPEYEGPAQWKHKEGLIDGIMVVDKRIFVPGCDTMVLGVKHSL